MRMPARTLVSNHRAICAVAIVAMLAAPASAHRGIDEQITRVSEALARTPDDAGLYLRRGELHRVHGDWVAARADYQRARALDPTLAIVELALGRMYLEAGQPRRALRHLDAFIAGAPEHVKARVMRARALVALTRHAEAAAEYTRVIDRMSGRMTGRATRLKPRPEYYLERARALAAGGRMREALRGLDEGLTLLGQPITLALYAIELEQAQHRHDAALARIDRLIAQGGNNAGWLARRGDILARAGRRAQARRAYRRALDALAELPAGRRQTRMARRLADHLTGSLAALSDEPRAASPHGPLAAGARVALTSVILGMRSIARAVGMA